MHDYKKLEVWKVSLELAGKIIKVSQRFPIDARFGLASQISRSAISIPSNIAEGAGRNTIGEFNNFLGIANGSAFELETQIRIAHSVGYITNEEFAQLSDTTDKVQKMIYKLKLSLK